MTKRLLHITFLLILLSGRVWAQLSPGDLSNAHRGWEGMSNCTQCHDIGNKVTNDKCLNCHKEIKLLIDLNRGHHANKEVRAKDCASCHSDHHGRNFDMVRFDEKNYNHNQAGYELVGKHKEVDCRKCHKPEYIADAGLKKRKDSYLGLEKNCLACHKDVHQKTLGNDCTKCHNSDAFKPAGKFNHDKANFALQGKHKTVACIDCHKKETRNGAEFQQFTGIAFANCNNCHKDPHDENLGNNCKQCHNDQSFTSQTGLNKFNHSSTPFPLKGKHKQVNCRECHKMDVTPLLVFQDRLGVKTNNCVACHKDVHEGNFGTNCAECHNEDGFRKTGNLDKFDHNKTKYKLEGKHITVDCKKCHKTEKMTDPLPHYTCSSCHSDYHEKQFVKVVVAPDCAECHVVDGFAESTFSLAQHAKTKFPLDGAHVATPCFSCHKKEEKWAFRNIGERCVDCHKDVHAGQIPQKHYPDNSCDKCHVTTDWESNKFDHNTTKFKLQGAHSKQDCRACHVPEEGFKYGKFVDLHMACAACHEDSHYKQFEKFGVTDCAQCHGNDAWTIKKFNHDKARFKLDGKHVNVACVLCHKEIVSGDKKFIQYKFDNFECVVCHR